MVSFSGCSEPRRKGVDALVVEGDEGRRVTILSRISKVAADEICAYANRWIGRPQVEAKQRLQNQVVDFNGGECHDYCSGNELL